MRHRRIRGPSSGAREIILAGLERLEYRGYDSAGMSLLADGRLESVRAVGNLSHLRAAVGAAEAAEEGGVALATRPATTGIGHTRWATHGRVTEENAHPHYDTEDRVHVVVNGIVENYLELKHELQAEGAVFTSETDAEVIAHLISRHLVDGELDDAVRAAYAQLRGHYAFVAAAAEAPGVLVAARKECPLVVGRGDGEQFVASAIPAFLAHTRDIQLIENGEIVVLRADDVEFSLADGTPVERAVGAIDWNEDVGREGRLRDVHAQGDPRAGGRRRGDDRRPHGARRRRRPRRPRLDRRRVPHRAAPGRHRRVRHLVPRRPDRALRDRAVGARPGRDGRRVGVPLPRPGRRRGRPRRSGSRSPARPPTRWPRCAWPGSAARRCSRSPT